MKDRFPTRIVVIALAVVVVGGLASIVFLASTQTPIPDAMDRLVFTALGSLGTILTRPTDDGTQDVQVVNDAADRIPVEQQPSTPPSEAE